MEKISQDHFFWVNLRTETILRFWCRERINKVVSFKLFERIFFLTKRNDIHSFKLIEYIDTMKIC